MGGFYGSSVDHFSYARYSVQLLSRFIPHYDGILGDSWIFARIHIFGHYYHAKSMVTYKKSGDC